MIVNIEDTGIVKRITVRGEIHIPDNATFDERCELGRKLDDELRYQLAKAAIHYGKYYSSVPKKNVHRQEITLLVLSTDLLEEELAR